MSFSSVSKISKILTVFALASLPMVTYAAAARSLTPEELAVQKVTEAVTQNDLKFVTAETSDICGTTAKAGIDVKVQIDAGGGRFITLRHYGVTYQNIFGFVKTIECAE